MRTLTGDALEASVYAGGAALGYRDGLLGVKGGKVNNEIDGNEALVFRPPTGGVANGATIEVGMLFSGSGGQDDIQEKGYVEIERPAPA